MTTEISTPRSARVPRAAASAILLAVVAACSPASAPSATPVASATPGTAGPTTNPTSTQIAGIQHKTGASDVVLRLESGGGFVPIDFLATNAPIFTLYGDELGRASRKRVEHVRA